MPRLWTVGDVEEISMVKRTVSCLVLKRTRKERVTSTTSLPDFGLPRYQTFTQLQAAYITLTSARVINVFNFIRS